jgi:LPS-assembly lipoprotein
VSTRYGQEVRNHLIFGLNGGAGQPANPLYSLDLGVTARASAAATIQRALEEEPTASMMTVASNYVLTDAKTGDVVARGRREVSSSYDVPRQAFAAMRAQRDAENRAARELAELLRLAIAQDLSKAR